MATEYPPLGRSYVISYSNNDRDFPIIGIRKDPRVDSYKIPQDLSPHPDSKRYPNHVFTGAQATNSDERVQWVYEILPAPWVPFTRYDDDLGPIQGRRRSVKNENQKASLTSSTKISYEGRDGSAIVLNEIEETWSIKIDEDGNSLFPVKTRNFYDPSRGAVEETRQLFVPTGNEEASLNNIDGVITQVSYEPYNEFLSYRVVQTYSVDGPKLTGKTTDNDGQLVTITTQRKGSDGYAAPTPTATKTVEASREDAESLIERILETPEVFKANTFSIERPDPIPQKFRVAVPIKSNQEVVEGSAEIPTLSEGDISKTEEQRNKFLKRTTATSRDQTVLPKTLTQKATNNERQEVTITETLQLGDTNEVPTATETVESEALGDGNFVVRKTQVPEVFAGETYRKVKEDITPQKFKAAQEDRVVEQTVAGTANPNITLGTGEFVKSEEQVNEFVKRVSTTARTIAQAVTLVESVLTPEGKTGTRKLTLTSGTQTFSPRATLIEANVEALGDGRTVKTETTIPEIFKSELLSIERPESIPRKFQTLVPARTNQFNIEGGVDNSIALEEGEISKSEQQQTDFIKRVSSTVRDQTRLPQQLTQKTTTKDLQQATVTEILQSGDTDELPTATTTIESEAMGDGNYIVRKTEIPEVFDSLKKTKQKPDTVPDRFRTNTPVEREEKVEEKTAIEEFELKEPEYLKEEQRLTDFTVQTTVLKREDNFNEIRGVELDEAWGISLPFTERIEKTLPKITEYTEVEGIGDGQFIVRDYTQTEVDSILEAFRITIPTTISLNLPRELKNISVDYQTEESHTEENRNIGGIEGIFKGLSLTDSGSISSTLSIIPRIKYEFKNFASDNIPATINLFFLKKDKLNLDGILGKTAATEKWPILKPQSFSETVYGKTEKKTITATISRSLQTYDDVSPYYGHQPSDGSQTSTSISLTPVTIDIPTCLTKSQDLSIESSLEQSESLSISLSYPQVTINRGGAIIATLAQVKSQKNLSHSIDIEAQVAIPETEPDAIPTTGEYLLNSSADAYKFGWFIVRATTFDASELA